MKTDAKKIINFLLIFTLIILLLCFIPPIRNFVTTFLAIDIEKCSNTIRNYNLWLLCGTIFFLSTINTDKINKTINFPKYKPNFPDRKLLVAVSLAFIICFGLRFYWLSQKEDFHEDELYSIGICNRSYENGEYSKLGFWYPLSETCNRGYYGKEILENAFFDKGTLSDSFIDIRKMWINTQDSPHPALYYMLLRFWFIGQKTHDINHIFFWGGLLNFLFFSVSFCLMTILVLKKTNNPFLTFFILLIAFANPTSVGISIFIRPYALQETAIVSFSFLLSKYINWIRNNTQPYNIITYISSALIIAFTFSAGYFVIFYVMLAGILLTIYFVKQKDYNSIIYFVSVFCLSALISKLMYLNFGNGLFEGRGQQAMARLTIEQRGNIPYSLKITIDFISNNFLYFALVLIVFVFKLYTSTNLKREKLELKSFLDNTIILPIIALCWIFLVMFFAPLKELRYIAPAFCILSFLFIFDIKKLNINNNFYNKSLEIIFVIFVFFVIKNSLPLNSNFQKMEHLQDTKKKLENCNFEFNKHPEIPVFVKKGSIKAYLFQFIDENQKYYFVENQQEALNYGLKKFYYLDVWYKDVTTAQINEKLVTLPQ